MAFFLSHQLISLLFVLVWVTIVVHMTLYITQIEEGSQGPQGDHLKDVGSQLPTAAL